MRLTLEAAPGGEAVRVVLMSKRASSGFRRARARDGARVAPDPSGRIQRLGAVWRGDRIHRVGRSMPTRALTRQLLPAPRPPPRTRRARGWWEVPDASETDRRGDAPEAATRERAERRRTTVDARLGKKKKRKKRVNGPLASGARR